MKFTDAMKTMAFVVGTAAMALQDKITEATTWQDLLTPYNALVFLSVGFLTLAAYWAKSPVPVAGENLNQTTSRLPHRRETASDTAEQDRIER